MVKDLYQALHFSSTISPLDFFAKPPHGTFGSIELDTLKDNPKGHCLIGFNFSDGNITKPSVPLWLQNNMQMCIYHRSLQTTAFFSHPHSKYNNYHDTKHNSLLLCSMLLIFATLISKVYTTTDSALKQATCAAELASELVDVLNSLYSILLYLLLSPVFIYKPPSFQKTAFFSYPLKIQSLSRHSAHLLLCLLPFFFTPIPNVYRTAVSALKQATGAADLVAELVDDVMMKSLYSILPSLLLPFVDIYIYPSFPKTAFVSPHSFQLQSLSRHAAQLLLCMLLPFGTSIPNFYTTTAHSAQKQATCTAELASELVDVMMNNPLYSILLFIMLLAFVNIYIYSSFQKTVLFPSYPPLKIQLSSLSRHSSSAQGLLPCMLLLLATPIPTASSTTSSRNLSAAAEHNDTALFPTTGLAYYYHQLPIPLPTSRTMTSPNSTSTSYTTIIAPVVLTHPPPLPPSPQQKGQVLEIRFERSSNGYNYHRPGGTPTPTSSTSTPPRTTSSINVFAPPIYYCSATINFLGKTSLYIILPFFRLLAVVDTYTIYTPSQKQAFSHYLKPQFLSHPAQLLLCMILLFVTHISTVSSTSTVYLTTVPEAHITLLSATGPSHHQLNLNTAYYNPRPPPSRRGGARHCNVAHHYTTSRQNTCPHTLLRRRLPPCSFAGHEESRQSSSSPTTPYIQWRWDAITDKHPVLNRPAHKPVRFPD
jgi:hypothetical protein